MLADDGKVGRVVFVVDVESAFGVAGVRHLVIVVVKILVGLVVCINHRDQIRSRVILKANGPSNWIGDCRNATERISGEKIGASRGIENLIQNSSVVGT